MALAPTPTLLIWHERGVGKSTLLLRLLCPVARQTGSLGQRASVWSFHGVGGGGSTASPLVPFCLYCMVYLV